MQPWQQQPANQATQLAYQAYQAYQAALQAALQAAQQAYPQKCSTCGIQNRSGALFCNSCGAPLGRVPSSRGSGFMRVLRTMYWLAVLALILSVVYFFFLSNLFLKH
jgi:membrane protease subunit (stomatin/prohibitin family)